VTVQYIECIHCGKRFPATEKMKAAMGTKVRCPECGTSFPIVVYEAKPADSKEPDRD